jgi:hypothetical protein
MIATSNLQRRRVDRLAKSCIIFKCASLLEMFKASARGRCTAERAGIRCRYADMCKSRPSSQASHMSKRQSTEEHG